MTVYFRDRTEEEDQENPTPQEAPRSPAGVVLDAVSNVSPAGAVVRSLPDQVTNYRYGRYRDNLRGERLARETIYDQADDEIHRITGQRLGNPERDDFLDPLSQRNALFDTEAETAPYLQWHARLAEMARSDPRLAQVYERYATPDRVTENARALRQGVTDEYHEYLGDGGMPEQIVRGVLGAPGMIVGALSSGSPEAVAQLAVGGGGQGLNLAERGARGALMGVLGQAAVEPAIIDDARRMGEEYPDRQVWLDFLIAAGFGATLDVGGGVVDGVMNPRPIEPDTSAPLQELASIFERWGGEPPQEALDRFAQTPAGEELQRSLAGQAESLIVSAHSRDAMVARAFPDLAEMDTVAMADEIVANQRFVSGEDDFPSQTPAGRRAEPEAIDAARRSADDAPMPDAGTREMISIGGRERPRSFERFDAASLQFDPRTFQYKQSEGATGSTGVLTGVEQWDNQSSGKIIVFEAADGTRYVADGHQRTALAQSIARRDGAQIMLDGVLYREREGWTAREVRNLAAQKNLRETPGDPIDTAQLIREAPELIDSSVPQRSPGFRVARGLAMLSDEAFRAVRAGQIEPRLGAVIGEVAGNRPEIHEALSRMFAESPPRTLREATFIAHEAMQAEIFRTQSAQMSMFGDAPELAGMRERAEILRVAHSQLRQDKRLFEIAARNADELERAGNILSRDENARRADLSDALLRSLDMLATRPSEVSRLLREVASAASAEKLAPSVAATRFVNGVVELFNQRGLVGLMQEQAPPVKAPEPINAPMLPRVQAEERSAKLRNGHDTDEEALRQSLAEVAVERALLGDAGDDISLDAIGHTPEADLARIEQALDALGIDDPTVAPVAAALYARPTPDMELEARARLTGEQTTDAPRTFAEVVEQEAPVEVWNPLDFEDSKKLIEKIDGATLPELDKVQRTFGLYGAGDGSRTRAEFRAAFMQEWSDVYGAPGFFAKGDGPDGGSLRDGPNAGKFALADPSSAPLSTVADWTRAVQREFPRYGKKLLERARLQIVQTVDELPNGGRGFYARLFDGVSKPEQRARMAESLEHVRTSIDGVYDVTDVYAWRASSGAVMAAEVTEFDPRVGAHVSFGVMTPGGIRIDSIDATTNLSNAIETFGVAMAAIDRDIANNRRVAYRFTGATTKHTMTYDRMMRAIEPPAGYVRATVVSDRGSPLSFVVVREDVARAKNIGSTISLTEALAMTPAATTANSAAMNAKRDFLYQRQSDDFQALIDKASVPPRPGAFARGRGVIGYTEQGQSWIVAGNAPVEMARGLTLHEVGVHAGLKQMLGPDAWEMLLDQVGNLIEQEDPDLMAGAATAAAKRTPDSQMREEALAYAIQNADPDTMSDGFRGLLMRVLNSVRAWLWKNVPGFRNMEHLTFEDMQFLALGGLRHAANNEPRTIDTRSLPRRFREAMQPKPRLLQDAVSDAGSDWLDARLFHGKSDRPNAGITFMSPSAKIAGLYGEIEAYEVRGPIFDASDDVIRTQDDFNRIVRQAREAGATGVYTRALDRGALGAQEQIVMLDSKAIRPAGSGRVDPNNPASVAAAEADAMDRVMNMLSHCQ